VLVLFGRSRNQAETASQVSFGAVAETETEFRSDSMQSYGHSRMLGAYGTPFGGRGGRMESAMVSLERAMVVSYRLSIVTVALSVTIRPQFAIECLRRSNQQGGGLLLAQI